MLKNKLLIQGAILGEEDQILGVAFEIEEDQVDSLGNVICL